MPPFYIRVSIFSMARWAKRRTLTIGSDSASRRSGSAATAAGPIPARAIHAVLREPSSAYFSKRISAGTAAAAFAPRLPIACAERCRTRSSGSSTANRYDATSGADRFGRGNRRRPAAGADVENAHARTKPKTRDCPPAEQLPEGVVRVIEPIGGRIVGRCSLVPQLIVRGHPDVRPSGTRGP